MRSPHVYMEVKKLRRLLTSNLLSLFEFMVHLRLNHKAFIYFIYLILFRFIPRRLNGCLERHAS